MTTSRRITQSCKQNMSVLDIKRHKEALTFKYILLFSFGKQIECGHDGCNPKDIAHNVGNNALCGE